MPGSACDRFGLFDVQWTDLEIEHVEKFLADAGDEGITWEAKADDERSQLKPDQIRKAACGLANQIGGYLLIGATRPKAGKWELPGITRNAPEPGHWLGQILRGLRPIPRFDIKTWKRADDRFAAVVLVDPIANAPCMTPQGRIYERVTSETLPVDDPVLLDKLFRRGEAARDRAAQAAPKAARRAIDSSGWSFQKSVGLSVALAPMARETDDISSRLFVKATREAMRDAVIQLMAELRPAGNSEKIRAKQSQDSHAAVIDFAEHGHYGMSNSLLGTERSTWLVQANWDGTVAASLTLSDEDVGAAPPLDEMLRALWKSIAPISSRLGGYGPSQLSVVVSVTKTNREIVQGAVVHAPGRPPPSATLYFKLPAETTLGRMVELMGPDEQVLASLHREIRRAAGKIEDED